MNRFQLNGQIGSGGMARVFQANWLLPGDQTLPVACKVLHPHRVDQKQIQLFCREALISLRISNNHPRLVSVYECFTMSDHAFCIVMELVEGCSVAELVRDTPRLPAPLVRRIAADVLDGLHYMHSLDVLHRDISPSNILISTQGEIKIADLGLAKPIPDGYGQSTNRFCTPPYASPEVIERGVVDARSDLYSLGAVLYELLAGHPPFGKETEFDRLVARLHVGEISPLPADVPADLRELIMGVLHLDPGRRTPSSAHDALAMLARDEDGAVAPADALARMVEPLYRKKLPALEMSLRRAGYRDDHIDSPIVVIGKPEQDNAWRITMVDEDEDDDPVMDALAPDDGKRHRPRLVRWLLVLALVIVLALVLVPVGYVGWRAIAGTSASVPQPTANDTPDSTREAPVPATPDDRGMLAPDPPAEHDKPGPATVDGPTDDGAATDNERSRRRRATPRAARRRPHRDPPDSQSDQPDTHFMPVPSDDGNIHIVEPGKETNR